jgi:hypothetical protein
LNSAGVLGPSKGIDSPREALAPPSSRFHVSESAIRRATAPTETGGGFKLPAVLKPPATGPHESGALKVPVVAAAPIVPAVVVSPPTIASAHSNAFDMATEEALAKGAVEHRLNTFLAWLKTSIGALAAFVVDSDGLVLANRESAESYVLATVAIGNAEQVVRSHLANPSEGNSMIELDASRILQLVRVETRVGRLGVGLVLAGPLDRARADLVRRMLRKVMGWEQTHESGIRR